MEIDIIQGLIKSFKEAKLSGLCLKCDEFELKLEKEQTICETNNLKNETPHIVSQNSNILNIQEEKVKEIQVENEADSTINIVAPIVGTFYSANNPKAEPFVKVGSKVKKGDIVCVIEAMKLMNEVESEVDGEILEVLVSNEDMVEYGQPLFIVK